MITKVESNMLEHCLKTGLHIIYQDKYLSFSKALWLAGMKSLKARRIELITHFSKKAYQSDKYRNWFCESEEAANNKTRQMETGASPQASAVQDAALQPFKHPSND